MWGLLAVGIFMGGYPPISETIPAITLWGQFVGMLVMAVLGFVPGYVVSLVMNKMGLLRASDAVQIAGMDVEVVGDAYPEEIKTVTSKG